MAFLSAAFLLLLVLLASAQRRDQRASVLIPRDGWEAVPHAYPWMVSLHFPLNSVWTHHCGGTLIKVCENCNQSDIVITAAHCVVQMIKESRFMTKTLRRTKNVKIVAGSHDLRKVTKRDLLDVKSIAYFPGWDPLGASGMRHDIAIIQISTPIRFTDKIRAIDLDKLNSSVLPMEGAECRAAGWGMTHHQNDVGRELREINATIVSGDICVHDLPETYYFYDDKWMTCAESHNGGATSCMGDSGSTLLCLSESGVPIAQGVVSLGGDACGDHKNTVFTTIRPHLMWIYATAYEKSPVADLSFLENRLAPMKFNPGLKG